MAATLAQTLQAQNLACRYGTDAFRDTARLLSRSKTMHPAGRVPGATSEPCMRCAHGEHAFRPPRRSDGTHRGGLAKLRRSCSRNHRRQKAYCRA